jgi:hypothetical protein
MARSAVCPLPSVDASGSKVVAFTYPASDATIFDLLFLIIAPAVAAQFVDLPANVPLMPWSIGTDIPQIVLAELVRPSV